MKAGRIISAYALERHGIAEAVSKMAFRNRPWCHDPSSILRPRDFLSSGSTAISLVELADGSSAVGNLVYSSVVR